MAVLEVVGDVEEAATVVTLGLDEVRVLDQPDERQLAVGDVGPVEGRELAVELEQQAQRGEVLDRAQAFARRRPPSRPGARELLEDVVGHGGEHAVVALRRPGRLELARVVSAPERAAAPPASPRSRRRRCASRAAGRSISTRPPPASMPALQRRRTAPPTSAAGSRASPRAASSPLIERRSVNLLHSQTIAIVVGALAELAAQQRAPDLLPGLAAHALLDPLARGDALVRRTIAARSAAARARRRPSARARAAAAA